jgi:cytochrome P450
MKSLSVADSQNGRPMMSLHSLAGPRGIPVFGNARQIIPEQMHRQLEDWSQLFGERYKIALGPRQVLVCSNPDDIAAVLKDRPTRFRRTTRLEMVAKELQMAGLFAANGEDWRRQRTLVMQAFNPIHVKSYFPSLQTVAQRFLKRLARQVDTGVAFEMEPDLMRYTVDVTAGLAFGTDMNTIESEGENVQKHLNDIFRMLQKRLFAPFPYWHWFKLSEDRALDQSVRRVGEAIATFIQAAHERMAQNLALYERPENLLEAMIAARDQDDTRLSESDLTGNVMTILLAGEDTTAHTLAWTIYLLHQHPNVFLRVREEADKVMGMDTVASSHEQLRQMDFIEACINESMRLRPVAPIIGGEANMDTEVADVSIKKGTMVLLLSRAGATDSRHFVNALDFYPDRWLAPASHENNRKVCIPFGSGPRLCPGRFLALEEMKILISLVAKNFDIERLDTPDGKPAQERMTFTMAPKGLRLKLRHRSLHAR